MNPIVLTIALLLGCFGGLALLGSAGYGLFAFFKQPAVAGAPTPAEISLHKTGRNLLIVAVVLFLMTCCCLPLATFGANLLFGDNNTSPNSGYNAGELPVQPANCGQLIAIDPKNPGSYGLTAPAGSYVVTELVDHNAKTILISYFYASEPVTAYTTGNTDFNVWYGYCSSTAAFEGAQTTKRERETENWSSGYSITLVGIDNSSSSCTQNIVAIDPGYGNAYTPANTFVVVETVNYSARTIVITYYYATSPVLSSINGEIHTNIWYGYCSLDKALEGAQTTLRERESMTLFDGYDISITK
ncbi:MAG: hypothetical protein WA061_06175 [Microgenomates group bacterium]